MEGTQGVEGLRGWKRVSGEQMAEPWAWGWDLDEMRMAAQVADDTEMLFVEASIATIRKSAY